MGTKIFDEHKNRVLEETSRDYSKGEKNPILEINFPLCLKCINKYKSIFWRYLQDGRYEVVTHNSNNKSFTFGNHTDGYHYEPKEYEQGYLIRQIELFEMSSQEEFIEKLQELFVIHDKFLNTNTDIIDEQPEEEYPF